MTKLLKIAEAAELLRISRTKLYQLVEDKRILHYRLDGRIVFSEEQIEEYLKQHVVGVAYG